MKENEEISVKIPTFRNYLRNTPSEKQNFNDNTINIQINNNLMFYFRDYRPRRENENKIKIWIENGIRDDGKTIKNPPAAVNFEIPNYIKTI